MGTKVGPDWRSATQQWRRPEGRGGRDAEIGCSWLGVVWSGGVRNRTRPSCRRPRPDRPQVGRDIPRRTSACCGGDGPVRSGPVLDRRGARGPGGCVHGSSGGGRMLEPHQVGLGRLPGSTERRHTVPLAPSRTRSGLVARGRSLQHRTHPTVLALLTQPRWRCPRDRGSRAVGAAWPLGSRQSDRR